MLSNNESNVQNDSVTLSSTIIWKNNGFRLPDPSKTTNDNLSIDKDIHPVFVRLPSISLNGKSTPCLKAALAKVASLTSQLTHNPTTTFNHPIKMSKPVNIGLIKSPIAQTTKTNKLLDADDEIDVVAMVPPKVDRKTSRLTKKKRKSNNDHFLDPEDEERTKALVQRLKLNTNTTSSTKTIAPNDEINKIKSIGPYLRIPCSQPQKFLRNGSLNKVKLILDIPKTISSTATRALISRELQIANSLTSAPISSTSKCDKSSALVSVISTQSTTTTPIIDSVKHIKTDQTIHPLHNFYTNTGPTHSVSGSQPGPGKPVIYSINNRRLVSLLQARDKTPLANGGNVVDDGKKSRAFTHFSTCQQNWLCAFCCRSAYGSSEKPNLSLGELFGPLLVKMKIPLAHQIPSRHNCTPKKGQVATMAQSEINEPSSDNVDILNRDTFPFKVYLHRPCVTWASSVAFGPNGFLNLDQAILQAALTDCSVCKSKGANIRCSAQNCQSWFHYACGLYADFLFEQSTYTAYCALHKNQRIEIMKY